MTGADDVFGSVCFYAVFSNRMSYVGSTTEIVSVFQTFFFLISILPKNQAAPIEKVISDFLEYSKPLLHLFPYVIKVQKPKGN